MQRGTPGDGRDLGNRSSTEMGGSIETSGGSQRIFVTSSWTVSPLLEELGGSIGCKGEKVGDIEQ